MKTVNITENMKTVEILTHTLQERALLCGFSQDFIENCESDTQALQQMVNVRELAHLAE